jgi:uncharacterized coiled-coil protein SlyX
MTDDNSSNLSEKLNKTREKLNLLSKKVAETTKSMVESTNNSIKSTISDHKEKRQKKREEKIEKAKSELSEDGLLDDVPSMITLPEFEQERMEIAAEQNDTMINIVEEMQRLSERIDSLESRVKAPTKEIHRDVGNSESNQERSVNNELMINQIIHMLGVSVIWIVGLIVGDWYSTENNIVVNDEYPLGYIIWSVGTSIWVFYVMQKMGSYSPLLKLPMILKIQIAMVVGITTLVAIVAYGGSTDAISNVWIWGSIVFVVLLLSASMITSVWKSTKKLLSVKDEVEIID